MHRSTKRKEGGWVPEGPQSLASLSAVSSMNKDIYHTNPDCGLKYVNWNHLPGSIRDQFRPLLQENGGRVFYFFEVVMKIGWKVVAQERVLAVTHCAVCQFMTTSTLRRNVHVLDIKEIYFSHDNWLGIKVPSQYDLLFNLKPEQCTKFEHVITALYRYLSKVRDGVERELPIVRLDSSKSIKSFLKLKKPPGWDPPEPCGMVEKVKVIRAQLNRERQKMAKGGEEPAGGDDWTDVDKLPTTREHLYYGTGADSDASSPAGSPRRLTSPSVPTSPPEIRNFADEEDEPASPERVQLEKRITEFYQEHNPEKLGEVKAIADRSEQDGITEEELVERLNRKYGLTPPSSPPARTSAPLPEPQRYRVGDKLEVLRSSGAWEGCTVVKADGKEYVVRMAGGAEKKVHRADEGHYLRSAPPPFLGIADYIEGDFIRTTVDVQTKQGMVKAGEEGIVVQVPGDKEGSVALVEVEGKMFNAFPGQIEAVHMGDDQPSDHEPQAPGPSHSGGAQQAAPTVTVLSPLTRKEKEEKEKAVPVPESPPVDAYKKRMQEMKQRQKMKQERKASSPTSDRSSPARDSDVDTACDTSPPMRPPSPPSPPPPPPATSRDPGESAEERRPAEDDPYPVGTPQLHRGHMFRARTPSTSPSGALVTVPDESPMSYDASSHTGDFERFAYAVFADYKKQVEELKGQLRLRDEERDRLTAEVTAATKLLAEQRGGGDEGIARQLADVERKCREMAEAHATRERDLRIQLAEAKTTGGSPQRAAEGDLQLSILEHELRKREELVASLRMELETKQSTESEGMGDERVVLLQRLLAEREEQAAAYQRQNEELRARLLSSEQMAARVLEEKLSGREVPPVGDAPVSAEEGRWREHAEELERKMIALEIENESRQTDILLLREAAAIAERRADAAEAMLAERGASHSGRQVNKHVAEMGEEEVQGYLRSHGVSPATCEALKGMSGQQLSEMSVKALRQSAGEEYRHVLEVLHPTPRRGPATPPISYTSVVPAEQPTDTDEAELAKVAWVLSSRSEMVEEIWRGYETVKACRVWAKHAQRVLRDSRKEAMDSLNEVDSGLQKAEQMFKKVVTRHFMGFEKLHLGVPGGHRRSGSSSSSSSSSTTTTASVRRKKRCRDLYTTLHITPAERNLLARLGSMLYRKSAVKAKGPDGVALRVAPPPSYSPHTSPHTSPARGSDGPYGQVMYLVPPASRTPSPVAAPSTPPDASRRRCPRKQNRTTTPTRNATRSPVAFGRCIPPPPPSLRSSSGTRTPRSKAPRGDSPGHTPVKSSKPASSKVRTPFKTRGRPSDPRTSPAPASAPPTAEHSTPSISAWDMESFRAGRT